jgi:GT2 family glycosyltransferase
MEQKPLISVVLVTYKRIDLLRQTVRTFLETTTYPRDRLELIVCDDASPAAIQEQMRQLPCDVFLLAEKNGGMGRNTNKGFSAARGDYIFHLQDDWKTIGRGDFLEAGLELLAERPDVGMVRFWRHFDGPYETHVCASGRRAHIYRNVNHAELGQYVYSDRPCLKRRSFHETLGPFAEHLPIPDTEVDFCKRFEAQDQVRIAWIEGYSTFENCGDELTFNPSIRKVQLVQRLEKHWLTRVPLRVYLRLRHGNA